MKTINAFFIVFFWMTTAVLIYAQPVVITPELQHPESAIIDGNFIYVTNIGKVIAPKEKDGDGILYKLDLAGKPVDLHFNKEPLNAPKGTAIIGNVLYVNDIDRIVAIDLHTGKKLDEIDLSSYGTLFLNDLAVKNNTTLFVSATDIGKIFSVSLNKPYHIEVLDLPVLKGPNGLYYDAGNNNLYVAGLEWGDEPTGEIGIITWKDKKCLYEQLIDVKGYFDGIQMLDKNTLVVSDWTSLKTMKARLLKIDLKQKTYIEICTGTDAADICYDRAHNTLLLPGLKDGSLFRYKMK